MRRSEVSILVFTLSIVAFIQSLFQRFQIMREHIISHLFALVEAVAAGGLEVGAEPDAGMCIFMGRLQEIVKGPGDTTRG